MGGCIQETGSGLLVSNSLIDEEKGERMVVLGGA